MALRQTARGAAVAAGPTLSAFGGGGGVPMSEGVLSAPPERREAYSTRALDAGLQALRDSVVGTLQA